MLLMRHTSIVLVSSLLVATFASHTPSPPRALAAANLDTATSVVLGADPRTLIAETDSFAVDASGNIHVSEPRADRVVTFAPESSSWTILIGGKGAGTAVDQVDHPRGVAVAPDGSVFVADTNNHRVLRIANGVANTVVAGGTYGSALNQLISPWSVAVGPEGELYVGDSGNARVLRFDTLGPDATGVVVAGGNGTGTALDQTPTPYGLALGTGTDPDIFVADFTNNRVMRWTQGASTGTEHVSVTDAPALSGPSALLFHGTDLYITSQSSNRVFVRHADGSVEVAFGTGGSLYTDENVRAPRGVARASASELLVLEANRITRRATDNSTTQVVAGYTQNPTSSPDYVVSLAGIDVDASGFLYTAEGSQVRKWDPLTGDNVVVAGGNISGSGLDELSTASHIEVDASGNIYVSEYSNHRVTKWAPGASEGVVVAGGNGSGSALDQLSGPRGIAIDAIGNLYIADGINNRIMKWAPGATTGEHIVGSTPASPSSTNFYWVRDVAIGPDGSLFMADYYGRRIVRWNEATSALENVTPGYTIGTPEHLAIDSFGNMIISSPSQSLLTFWASGASEGEVMFQQGTTSQVAGVVFDSEDRAWYADEHYHTVLATRIRGSAGIVNPGTKTVGDAPFTVETTGVVSPTAPAVSVSPSSVCTATGATVTIVGPGTCSIQADVNDALLFAASSPTLDVTVLPAPTPTTSPAPTTAPTTPPSTPATPDTPTTTAPPVETPPTTAPAAKKLTVSCKSSKRVVTCTPRKPSSISSKTKISYKTTCVMISSKTSTVKSKTVKSKTVKSKTVKSSASRPTLKLQLKKGKWTCSTQTTHNGVRYSSSSWTKTIK
jgi:hypothetical protein